MNYFTRTNADEKILLADSFGIKLFYLSDKNIVELEIGITCLRLNPSLIQRIANVMMKASLQLDHIEAKNKRSESGQNRLNNRPHMAH
ncbi:MAG: hypothetical protein BVN34_08860 [Proteobacteria bacterium ST_bin12]|nr:MAG: hypothetical protein BVN34_08860 [Proteobacteria bacterium ST_bin12]